MCGCSRPENAPEDIALVPLPLFHVYACVGVQSHCLVSRTPMALVPNPRDIDDLLKTIATRPADALQRRPALFIALLNHPKVKSKSVDFSSIRACFSGAAPLMAATKTQFEELTGGRIVEGYSLTEAMMACVVNPLNGSQQSRVGRAFRCPMSKSRSSTPKPASDFLGSGETGEIIVRAPQLMAGYFNNPEETARALRTHGAGGPLASHRRSRLPRRRLVSFHRRSPEGSDQNERLPGLAARDRRSPRRASGRAGSRRRRRPGCPQRGSREGVGRQAHRD